MLHRSRVSYRDDRTVPTHVPCSVDANEEVEDYELERTTVIVLDSHSSSDGILQMG